MSPSVLDSEGLFAATLALGEHLENGTRRAADLELEPGASQLVIFAAGPDAVAGEALCAVGGGRTRMPVVLVADGVVPGFVDASSLCVAVGTRPAEPALAAALADAAGRGAAVLAIGRPQAFAARPARLELPPEIHDARDGFGDLVAAVFSVAAVCGALPDAGDELAAAVAQAAMRRQQLEEGPGAAVELARAIGRSFPLVVGCGALGAVVARRFAATAHLSAKLPAFAAAHPGAARSLASGFGQAGDVTRQLLTLVDVRSDFDPPGLTAVANAFVEVVGETMVGVYELRAEGVGALAQLVDLVLTCDAAALYLAAAEGIDPGPSPAIDAVADATDLG